MNNYKSKSSIYNLAEGLKLVMDPQKGMVQRSQPTARPASNYAADAKRLKEDCMILDQKLTAKAFLTSEAVQNCAALGNLASNLVYTNPMAAALNQEILKTYALEAQKIITNL